MVNVLDQAHGQAYSAFNCDAVEFASSMPASSVGLSVYSPPFSQLYVYSESERDMGNVANHEEFADRYRFLVRELFRATKPGRVSAVHCSDLPTSKQRDGVIGLFDLPALIREVHEGEGWIYHSRVTIWKCPVVEMTRTKAHGLLYKTLRTDGSRVRVGMPDYMMVFRKESDGKTPDPVVHAAGEYPVSWWQEAASPVWMTINQTNVLNVAVARESKDEKHLCPLQLDVIERCVELWSNRGDTVFSPFMGIGSEGVVSLRLGRRFVGTELKPAYFRQASKNLALAASAGSTDLVSMMAEAS